MHRDLLMVGMGERRSADGQQGSIHSLKIIIPPFVGGHIQINSLKIIGPFAEGHTRVRLLEFAVFEILITLYLFCEAT